MGLRSETLGKDTFVFQGGGPTRRVVTRQVWKASLRPWTPISTPRGRVVKS